MSDEKLFSKTPDVLSTASDGDFDYNPFEFIEGEDDEDWEGSDASLLPSSLPPQQSAPKVFSSVYSPERAGSVAEALTNLVQTNAARRHILLSIVDWARDGIDADALFARIAAEQADNLSVYEPVSYCRMLQRAGALELETGVAADEADAREAEVVAAPANKAEAVPVPACEEETMPVSRVQNAEDGAEPADAAPAENNISYMTIDTSVKPRWIATPEGLEAYEALTQGAEWRQVVLVDEAIYQEVYLAIMRKLADGSLPKTEITDLAESFEVTWEPRRWGAHFIDMLEATQAIRWSNADAMWSLTDLGKQLLPELEQLCATTQGGEAAH